MLVWVVTGPLFGYSDTWQLVINTGTTIVTFLMVFLIQNTQNRDAEAIHLKLDELIRAGAHARNALVELELLADEGSTAVAEGVSMHCTRTTSRRRGSFRRRLRRRKAGQGE